MLGGRKVGAGVFRVISGLGGQCFVVCSIFSIAHERLDYKTKMEKC